MGLIHAPEETLRKVRFWKDGTGQRVTTQQYCPTAVLPAQRVRLQPTSIFPLHAVYTWKRKICRTGKKSGCGKSAFQQSSPFIAGQYSCSQRRAAIRAAVTCARKHFWAAKMHKATEAGGSVLVGVCSGPVTLRHLHSPASPRLPGHLCIRICTWFLLSCFKNSPISPFSFKKKKKKDEWHKGHWRNAEKDKDNSQKATESERGQHAKISFIYFGNLVVHPACQRSALYSWQKLLCSQEKF